MDPQKLLTSAQSTVFKTPVPLDKTIPSVRGYDFSDGLNYDKLFSSFATIGAQATSFGKAIEEVNRMLSFRLADDPINPDDDDTYADPKVREETKCTIFFGFTSNMISCGTRETVKFLAQNKLVDVMVTTCGAIEEDILKTFGEFKMGDFHLDVFPPFISPFYTISFSSPQGATLRENGQNRIGNMLVSNDLYCQFEDFLSPILLSMLKEQKEKGTRWTPSKLINRIGKEINHPSSYLYWCYKNDIPVFCPAITDGAVGDNIFFFNAEHPGLILDLVEGFCLHISAFISLHLSITVFIYLSPSLSHSSVILSYVILSLYLYLTHSLCASVLHLPQISRVST